jgi:hypothetical protein
MKRAVLPAGRVVAQVSAWVGATAWVVLAATVAQFGLGLWVLQRAGRHPAGRALGGWLLLQPFAFGLFFLGILKVLQGQFILAPLIMGFALQGFPPALLVTFALSHPTPPAALQGRWAWVRWLPLIPAIAFAVVVTWLAVLDWDPGEFRHFERGLAVAHVGAPIFALVGGLGAAITFIVRRRRARTELARRRITVAFRAAALPFLLVAIPLTGLLAFMLTHDPNEFSQEVIIFIVVAFFLLFAGLNLVPGVGLALSVLRYRVLDFDRALTLTFRFTLSRAVVVGAFVLAFFAVHEAATRYLEQSTNSTLIAILGAASLALVLKPLERAADRVAERVVPDHAIPNRLAVPRPDIYRATFEDYSVDRRISGAERRALDALARHLGLDGAHARRIEGDVIAERARARGGSG